MKTYTLKLFGITLLKLEVITWDPVDPYPQEIDRSWVDGGRVADETERVILSPEPVDLDEI